MHVTKKHVFDYHAWYNYPQISSQDYEVLAATIAAIFLYFFPQKRRKIKPLGRFFVIEKSPEFTIYLFYFLKNPLTLYFKQ